ncbi:MAG: glycosyltransferase family 4 protein [Phycisphaerae bacterium]
MTHPSPHPPRPPYRIGFVLEQTLGHVVHAQLLQHYTALDPAIDPVFMPILPWVEDRYNRIPGIRSNWTLLASLRARDAVRKAHREKPFDALFFHTQVTALFAAPFMRRLPTVVSLDATPLNMDSLAAAYSHKVGKSRTLESLKNRLNRRVFSRAAHLVTWSDWVRQSLLHDYRIPTDHITVIPPGVDPARWEIHRDPPPAPSSDQPPTPLRLLFVGGEFNRKGGQLLLDAFRQSLHKNCRLDIVTRDPVDTAGLPNIHVHHGISANSPEMLARFANADLFILPTRGDMLALVIIEAMAASLPVITTRVGALPEAVIDNHTGLLIPPDNLPALIAAVQKLVADPTLRHHMSTAARTRAQSLFDAAKNYPALLTLLKHLASRKVV